MIDVSTLINKIPAPERSAFQTKVSGIASRLGVPSNHLMAIMDLESGLNPAIKNSLGYTGLIQFGDLAAKDLGTTTAALQKMDAVTQLDYVEKYFNLWKKRLGITKYDGFVDLYLTVFYPTGIKETDPNKPFSTPKVEAANPALRDSTGHITKNSIKAAYEKRYEGLYEKTTDFVKKNPLVVASGVVLLGLAIYVLYKELYLGKDIKIAGL